jgi:hypothetical protein
VSVHGHLCTGTLVDEQTVVTASHCLPAATSDVHDGLFVISKERARHQFHIVGWKTWGELGLFRCTSVSGLETRRCSGANVRRDLAVLRLSLPVPPDVAKPARIARDTGELQGPLLVFGHGCLDSDVPRSFARKRRLQYFSSYAPRLCYGDGGSPVFDRKGEIVLIASLQSLLSRGGGAGADVRQYRRWVDEASKGLAHGRHVDVSPMERP